MAKAANPAADYALAQYRSIFETVGEGLVVVTLDGLIVDANPAAARLVGAAPDEIMGTQTAKWLPQPGAFDGLRDIVSAGGTGSGELVLRLPDGELIDVEVTATPIERANGRHVLAVVRNISERKRAALARAEWTRVLEERVAARTEALARLNEQLQRDIAARRRAEASELELQRRLARARRMEALGVMAGGVAHDLNNLLSPLLGYPDLLLAQLPPDSRLREHVVKMKTAAGKAGAVARDLLTLARRGVVHTSRLHLRDVVQDYLDSSVWSELARFHPQVRLETRGVIDAGVDGEPPVIEGSAKHLFKGLMNLVMNACDAMEGGGLLTIATRHVVLAEERRGFEHVPPGDYAVLEVADTGHGIPEADFERVFEPFYSTRAIGRSGSGLGLAVVYGVARDHGAYLDVTSTVGRGTTIGLWFPGLAPAAAAPAPEEAP